MEYYGFKFIKFRVDHSGVGDIALDGAAEHYFYNIQRRASPPSIALDYWGRLRRRSHSPRAERIKVKPPSPPSAQSVQTKKKPPGDLAISP